LSSCPAIVLAGGPAHPEIAAAAGVTHRADIPYNGRRMVDFVVDALAASPAVDGVAVVGPLPPDGRYTVAGDRGGFVPNIYSGLEVTHTDAPFVLLATCDIPFLTAESVTDFVEAALPLDADLVWPVVTVEACYARYPGIKRTALTLHEGNYTGGNLMLLKPSFLRSNEPRISQAFAARKSPLRLGAMLGPGTLMRVLLTLALKRPFADIASLEQAVSRLIGGKARAVVSGFPELATDIDRAGDLAALQANGGV
jgi:molybdopterin-guanine dinucleotide biosynthesis protein A